MTLRTMSSWALVLAVGAMLCAPALQAQTAEELQWARGAAARGKIPADLVSRHKPVTIETWAGQLITWDPQVPFSRGRLTVVGRDSIVWEQEIAPGGAISYPLKNAAGEPLADGFYTYELILLPIVDVGIGVPEGKAAEDDPQSGPQPWVRSDRFQIRGGALAQRPKLPALTEETAPDAANSPTPNVFDETGVFAINGKLAVGIDTTLPFEDIHIVGDVSATSPAIPTGIGAGIYMDMVDGATAIDADWQLTGRAADFRIGQTVLALGPTSLFTLEYDAPANSLYVRSNGNVGLGTATPGRPLSITHIQPEILFLDSDAGTDAGIELRDNRFSLEGDLGQQDVIWFDTRAPADSLTIASDGTVALSSSRTRKTDIEPIVGGDILARLSRLPLYSWRYNGAEASPHLGPMAEDFHAVFGLGGDERLISPIDTAGVALGAAQELYGQLQAREQELAELKAAQAELLTVQAELMRRLEALEQAPPLE